MLVMTVLIHFVWASVPPPEVSVMVLIGVTTIDPVAVVWEHVPVVVTA